MGKMKGKQCVTKQKGTEEQVPMRDCGKHENYLSGKFFYPVKLKVCRNFFGKKKNRRSICNSIFLHVSNELKEDLQMKPFVEKVTEESIPFGDYETLKIYYLLLKNLFYIHFWENITLNNEL